MSLDFQSIRQQVMLLGENALEQAGELQNKREQALEILVENAQNLSDLRQKVEMVVRSYDPSLRCALPVAEPLTLASPLPNLPEVATLIAADGSQITPDRHAEVNFALINTGAIQMKFGSADPPETSISSELLYDEQLYSAAGTLTEAQVALLRDIKEREILVKLAKTAAPPVVTFTDGPMELWGAKSGESAVRADFQERLKQYLEVLNQLYDLNVITAGYIDKPAANLVVRTLEVSMVPDAKLSEIADSHPLWGVTDIALYRQILQAGERSPIFAMQSQMLKSYRGALRLHFFYLNVGQTGRPYLVRVEIPAWVAENEDYIHALHAILIDQCRLMGGRPYPYLLHRAHETAVVRLEEKTQVTQMITQELRQRGLNVGEISSKQYAKQVPGRTRFSL
ncbi:MAG: DNA double-strand break repair nuclease NurA [Chloroflexota bacterium]|nr:MAG: DNA double-strand break repair nuclease NurA [Chloroflexota bacterium]